MVSVRYHKICLKSHRPGEMIAMYNTEKGLVLQDNKQKKQRTNKNIETADKGN